MENVIKLSQEELNQLNQIKNGQENLLAGFGELEYKIQSLEIQKDQLVEALAKLKETEVEVGKVLSEKYGEGSINLEDGTFTKSA